MSYFSAFLPYLKDLFSKLFGAKSAGEVENEATQAGKDATSRARVGGVEDITGKATVIK